MCYESVCVALSCGGGFTPRGAYDSVWDSVELTGNSFFYYFQYHDSALDSVMPMKGKYTIYYSQYQGVRCAAMSCGGGFTPGGGTILFGTV